MCEAEFKVALLYNTKKNVIAEEDWKESQFYNTSKGTVSSSKIRELLQRKLI